MKIGLKTGAHGTDVERLQRTLLHEGHKIERAEIEGRHFGHSTLAALHAFQAKHGLQPTRQSTKQRLTCLLTLKTRLRSISNEAPVQPPSPKPNPERATVTGDSAMDYGYMTAA